MPVTVPMIEVPMIEARRQRCSRSSNLFVVIETSRAAMLIATFLIMVATSG